MKLVILVMLAVLTAQCHSQSGQAPNMTDPSNMTEPSDMTEPSNMTFPPEPQNVTVTVVRGYRFNDPDINGTAYQAVYENDIYDGPTAAPFRYAHYNCLERDGRGVIQNRVPSDYVLTIFLQIPVLHFLNLPYKIELMESIRTMLNISSNITRNSDYNPEEDRNVWFMNKTEICIDGYDQAFVSSYDEGIMLRVYEQLYNNATTMYQPQSTGEELRQRFLSNRNRVGESFGSPQRTPVTTFGGEPAVFYNGPNGRAAVNIEQAVWAGRRSINIGGCRQLNPQYNSLNGIGLTGDELRCISLDTDEQDDIRENLAVNPNPINYYLEAGDYVFAVLGGLAIAIVLGLATLGYFIHPFFLA